MILTGSFKFQLSSLSFVIFKDLRADLVVGSTWKPSHTAKPPTLLAFVSLSGLILTELNVCADGEALGKQSRPILRFFHLCGRFVICYKCGQARLFGP